MYPDSLLERYRAVDALAQRGAPGERDNARRIVERMDRDHPNIRAWAFPPQPAPEPTEWYESNRARQAGGAAWDRFRDAASGAFSWASKLAQEVMAAEQARSLADEICEVQIKALPSGKWQMALRIDRDELLAAAENLTPFQKVEFVQHILGALEGELHEVLRGD